jgi:hypothetical protein
MIKIQINILGNIMDLFHRLLIDAGFVIFLILSVIIGDVIVSCLWMGIIGLPIRLQSLSFHLMGLGAVFIGIPLFSPVIANSYFCGNIAYNIDREFNYLDTLLISIFCFICMFIIMGGLRISEDLEISEEYRKQGHTHYLRWERIDESVTPAAIVTLLIMSGLILSCYFNNLN